MLLAHGYKGLCVWQSDYVPLYREGTAPLSGLDLFMHLVIAFTPVRAPGIRELSSRKSTVTSPGTGM